METFWVLWVPFGPFGTSFGGPGERNEVPKGAQERFYGYHENVDFPQVFHAFWRSGLSPGAPNGGFGGIWETLLAQCWLLCVTFW